MQNDIELLRVDMNYKKINALMRPFMFKKIKDDKLELPYNPAADVLRELGGLLQIQKFLDGQKMVTISASTTRQEAGLLCCGYMKARRLQLPFVCDFFLDQLALYVSYLKKDASVFAREEILNFTIQHFDGNQPAHLLQLVLQSLMHSLLNGDSAAGAWYERFVSENTNRIKLLKLASSMCVRESSTEGDNCKYHSHGHAKSIGNGETVGTTLCINKVTGWGDVKRFVIGQSVKEDQA